MPISAGIPAPDFALSDETGVKRKLSDYRGKPVILYFYPKDDTPGCTTEACNFRNDYSQYEQAGVVILGVSRIPPKCTPSLKPSIICPLPSWRMRIMHL